LAAKQGLREEEEGLYCAAGRFNKERGADGRREDLKLSGHILEGKLQFEK